MKVLAFSREAGGAEAIAPICKTLNRDDDLLLIASGYAVNLFNHQKLKPIEFHYNEKVLEDLCHNKFGTLPERLLTSAASLPHIDMTERQLWQWAHRKNILSVAVLDQWQNYALRFSGQTPNERLVYFPDKICVMDDLAKNEMIEDGVPLERIVITGQPAFERLQIGTKNSPKKAEMLRSKLNISTREKILTFVAESLQKDFGNTLGYNELTTFDAVGTILSELNLNHLTIIIKLHPENQLSEFKGFIKKWPNLNIHLIKDEFLTSEIFNISTFVIGMSSIMLVEADIVGKPVISLEINALREPQLALTRCGVIPFIQNHGEASGIIKSMLTDPSFLSAHIAKQTSWSTQLGATKKCLSILKD